MKALIAGAGIGGISAAIGLSKAGFQVEVYEQAPRFQEVGAGLTLWANAMRALDHLGVGEAIRKLANPEIFADLRTWQGEVLVHTRPSARQNGTLGMSFALSRTELHETLLQFAAGVDFCLGKRLTGFTEDSGGVVGYFDDGSLAKGDLLIGADGLHSVVRAKIHGKEAPRYAGYTAWRATVPFDSKRLSPGESWGIGARFGQVPLSGERVYWYATHNTVEGQHNPNGEREELSNIFHNWQEPIGALIEATPENTILRSDIYDRPALRHWGVGRVTLLGDAAHPMTPNLGQGACQAIEDAVILMQSLINLQPDIPAGLRHYEQKRIPRTQSIVEMSHQVGWLGQWSQPFFIPLRVLLMRWIVARFHASLLTRILDYEV